MKKWSKKWKSSKKPKKQRKYRYNAPKHTRKNFVTSMLSKNLREKIGTSNLPLREGDKVEIMRGDHKEMVGSVTRVDYDNLKVYIDGIDREKVDGSDVKIPIEPSNVKIVKLNLDDERRLSKYEVEEEAKEEIMAKEEETKEEEENNEEEKGEEKEEEPEVEESEETDYEELVSNNISEIKEKVEELGEELPDEEFEKAVKKILEAEKANKDRKTLKSYLEKR